MPDGVQEGEHEYDFRSTKFAPDCTKTIALRHIGI